MAHFYTIGTVTTELLSHMSLPELLDHLVPTTHLAATVTRALNEDLGERGDVTSAVMIAPNAQAQAAVRSRQPGVVAGVPIALEVIRQAAPAVRTSVHVNDGERVEPGKPIVSFTGSLAQMLAAERTLLNFLSRLSGVASATAACVDAVQGTRAVICDTRKTTPGLRNLEKYAVRCGGGTLHRIGLYDAMLVKDNHVAGMSPAQMVAAVVRASAQARAQGPLKFVMVECDTMDQFQELLSVPHGVVDIALLDNMTPEELQHAVTCRDRAKSSMQLEASGGVHVDNVLQVAQCGVDRISIGSITHSAPWLDLGMDIAL